LAVGGCPSDFETPILKSRTPEATKKDQRLGQERSEMLNKTSSKFMLRRTGDVIAKFLPPKRAPPPLQA